MAIRTVKLPKPTKGSEINGFIQKEGLNDYRGVIWPNVYSTPIDNEELHLYLHVNMRQEADGELVASSLAEHFGGKVK